MLMLAAEGVAWLAPKIVAVGIPAIAAVELPIFMFISIKTRCLDTQVSAHWCCIQSKVQVGEDLEHIKYRISKQAQYTSISYPNL
jgi:hypothetical protein